jgi:hypothetical protein
VLLYTMKRVSYLPVGGPSHNTRALQMLLGQGGANPNVLVQGKPLLILLCENAAIKVRRAKPYETARLDCLFQTE